ncbi:hypothetical protein T11_2093 [Trichinella zimbabwensis]|uniref:Uncharacterized protein n=1 Tax=Trichinella zimbabwensis TaxID=268475 RepID=A0A0V1HIB9_9BILA|nr:hypothetical protein T11_2093 [Trichinella zimbabwensis]
MKIKALMLLYTKLFPRSKMIKPDAQQSNHCCTSTVQPTRYCTASSFTSAHVKRIPEWLLVSGCRIADVPFPDQGTRQLLSTFIILWKNDRRKSAVLEMIHEALFSGKIIPSSGACIGVFFVNCKIDEKP